MTIAQPPLVLGQEQIPDLAATKEVLSYFVRHPLAADDLEGIARWRLLAATIGHKVEETNRALAWLVAQGFLCPVNTGGPAAVFMLNPDSLDRARAFLAAAETRAAPVDTRED